jgi:hypothetical protein
MPAEVAASDHNVNPKTLHVLVFISRTPATAGVRHTREKVTDHPERRRRHELKLINLVKTGPGCPPDQPGSAP